MRKFVKVYFVFARKEAISSEVRKALKKDPAWSWLLVGDSSYPSGDVGITSGDSKLRQINLRVNPLIWLLVFLLSVFA
jgi:hypothetical protein